MKFLTWRQRAHFIWLCCSVITFLICLQIHRDNEINTIPIFNTIWEDLTTQSRSSETNEIINLNTDAQSVLAKIKIINAKLQTLRKNLTELTANHGQEKLNLDTASRYVVHQTESGYKGKLGKFSCVHSLNFDVHENTVDEPHDLANFHPEQWLILNNYYTSTASMTLFEVKAADLNRSHFNKTFSIYVRNSIRPTRFYDILVPENRSHGDNNAMFIFTNALVSNLGEAFCQHLQYKPEDCMSKHSSTPFFQRFIPKYSEVFVISAYWGEFYYHRLTENLSRLIIFHQFLQKNPSIKIHTIEGAGSIKLLELLGVLGFERNRVISGWVKADVVYLPRITKCGHSNFLEGQLLSLYFQVFINSQLLQAQSSPKNEENVKSNIPVLTESLEITKSRTIVLIKRSVNRYFTNHHKIVKVLKTVAAKFSLDFRIFTDDPSPTLFETMKTFNSAVMIVAPHGAGLTNMFFSEPGTAIIEGVCNHPHINLCFRSLSYSLGMRWFGMLSNAQDCENSITVDEFEVGRVAAKYLKALLKDK